MEYCHGDKITDIDVWGKRDNDPAIIARQVVEIYMEQFLFIGLIHYDPHPGNILVTGNNKLVLLDFGMAGEITDRESQGIKDTLKAFTEKDYIRIIEILYDLGFIRKGFNKASLLAVMEYFFDEVIYTVKIERESMQSVDLNPVIDDLVKLIYTQPFILPIEWAYVSRTIGVLVGIISSLNPDFKVYDELKPYATRLLRLNMDEMIDNRVERLKTNAAFFYNLPHKVNRMVDDLERGSLKVKVDFDEVFDKIDELKFMMTKSFGFGIAFFTAFGAYTFFVFDKIDSATIMGGFSLVTFVFSFRYRKIFSKEYIKKNILK